MTIEREHMYIFIEAFAKGKTYALPKRHVQTMQNIRTVKPGIDSPIFLKCIENIQHLADGGILMLSGKYGCGKTFAACCMVPIYLVATGKCREDHNEIQDEDGNWITKQDGYRFYNDWQFVTSHSILKAAFNESDLFGTSDLLIVDDIGWEHFTDKGFGISEWDRFFDIRYRNMLPTILTTNLTVTEFQEKYTKRIYDRLRECAVWYESAGKSLRVKKKKEPEKNDR